MIIRIRVLPHRRFGGDLLRLLHRRFGGDLLRPHIHRSLRGGLLCLLSGTVLPSLPGEDQKVVTTLSAGSSTDKIRINSTHRGDQLVCRHPQHLRSVPPPPPRQPRHPTCLAPLLASRRLTCSVGEPGSSCSGRPRRQEAPSTSSSNFGEFAVPSHCFVWTSILATCWCHPMTMNESLES